MNEGFIIRLPKAGYTGKIGRKRLRKIRRHKLRSIFRLPKKSITAIEHLKDVSRFRFLLLKFSDGSQSVELVHSYCDTPEIGQLVYQ